MTVFSFKTLAFAWTGLAGVAAVGAGALQASYVPPAAEAPQAALVTAVPLPVSPPVPAAAAHAPTQAPVPFENHSLLAMLPPPDVRPHPALPHVAVAEPLPVPPVPPAVPASPLRVAHAEPRRLAPVRAEPREPAYAAAEPAYPGWDWGRRLPYPGQFASGRGYYYGGQPSYYGW